MELICGGVGAMQSIHNSDRLIKAQQMYTKELKRNELLKDAL